MSTKAQEERKKQVVIGVFAVLVLFMVYRVYDSFFGGTTTVTAPPVIVATPTVKNGVPGKQVTAPPGYAVASKVGTTSGALDPTLHMDAMRVTEGLLYTGSGRNIFGAGAAQEPPKLVKIVAAVAPPRPLPPVYTPPLPPPTCPPTCPPITLKFFGTSTSASGVRRAFLLQGDDVFLAQAGDVVQRKYRVVSIAANSIVIEDIPNVNKQTLPLVMN